MELDLATCRTTSPFATLAPGDLIQLTKEDYAQHASYTAHSPQGNKGPELCHGFGGVTLQ